MFREDTITEMLVCKELKHICLTYVGWQCQRFQKNKECYFISNMMMERILKDEVNTLNAELNPICYLLALLGAHHFLHVSRIRIKSLTLRLLMSYIYGAPILDVSRSHTTTHHSR